MLPWGRERLADSEYNCAQAELNKPNPNMSLVRWHLDCATNLNPQFLEAILLKEKVTGQVVTTVDNSSIRSFVRKQILGEQARASLRPPEEPTQQDVRIYLSPQHVVTTQPAVLH
jgi:hypothetical protein